MNRWRLCLRNLRYHWRANLAVLLGVAVGTSVLTGALLVGDSLRGSLRTLTHQQLGWVQQALVTGRFFRQQLATELNAPEYAPLLLLRGSAKFDTAAGVPRRAARINIIGVDARFWTGGAAKQDVADNGVIPISSEFWNSGSDEAVLNESLARELGVHAGETITVFFEKTSAVPRETLLGHRDAADVVDAWQLRVGLILTDQSPQSQFSLRPATAQPRNAFLPLAALQKRLGSAEKINAILIGASADSIQAGLASHLTLADWGLKLYSPQSRTRALFAKLDRNNDGVLQRSEWRGKIAEAVRSKTDVDNNQLLTRQEILNYFQSKHPYLSLESTQMLIEPVVEAAALEAAQGLQLRAAPTLVYLANSIGHSKRSIPYSIVAALDPTLPFPLGPFQKGNGSLKDDEIILAAWSESPLKPGAGESIDLSYFPPEETGAFTERTESFRFREFTPLTGAALDPDLTPEFPGITDKLDIRDWNPPFPYENKRIQKRDEDYWRQFRTTPKAYVALSTGQRLWGGRFGRLTSLRLATADLQSIDALGARFEQELLRRLAPEQGGFLFRAVLSDHLQASAGGVDFGLLFLGFSSFLIAAALLMVGLMYRLNLDRRSAEIGLLLATGYAPATVRNLLLGEGTLLALVGGVVGCIGSLGYTQLVLSKLGPTLSAGPLLRLHVTTGSLIIGYAASLFVSIATIAWATRAIRKMSPSALLAGTQVDTVMLGTTGGPSHWTRRITIILTTLGLGVIAWSAADRRLANDHELLAGLFFTGGAALLAAGLCGAWAWMKRSQAGESASRPIQPSASCLVPLGQLAVRNVLRFPTRSLLTAGLLACASFLLIAVDSFRREPPADVNDPNSPSGGFGLVADSDVPVFQDLNRSPGRMELNFDDTAQNQLKDVEIVALRLHGGDDASCLNLYQPLRPRLLGVPATLIQRGGFVFQSKLALADASSANAWTLLNHEFDDGAIPVVGEANTVLWMLKSGLGGAIVTTDERGHSITLRVVGLLKDSVFQSELLLSESNFLKLFPSQTGYNFFLIRGPADSLSEVQDMLNRNLAERGFVAVRTSDRLATFLAVENMYLSTFQALGGLGLLLGSLGLAVVLLRAIWERRSELALLRALGYRNGALAWLILAENGFLMFVGISIGTGAAIISVAPHVIASGNAVSLTRLLLLLAGVMVIGLGSGAIAFASTLRTGVIVALRRE